jgi:hypothetical protein
MASNEMAVLWRKSLATFCNAATSPTSKIRGGFGITLRNNRWGLSNLLLGIISALTALHENHEIEFPKSSFPFLLKYLQSLWRPF